MPSDIFAYCVCWISRFQGAMFHSDRSIQLRRPLVKGRPDACRMLSHVRRFTK